MSFGAEDDHLLCTQKGFTVRLLSLRQTGGSGGNHEFLDEPAIARCPALRTISVLPTSRLASCGTSCGHRVDLLRRKEYGLRQWRRWVAPFFRAFSE